MASLSAAREVGWAEANKENIPPAPSDGDDANRKAAGAAPALKARAPTPTLDAPLPPAPGEHDVALAAAWVNDAIEGRPLETGSASMFDSSLRTSRPGGGPCGQQDDERCCSE